MEPSSHSSVPETTERRGFLASASTIVIGAIVSLTPIASGILFFLDPILRRQSTVKGGDADGYLSVTNLNRLPDDGKPVRFALRADKIDAWNLAKNQSIGTVYLRKMPGNQVIAFNDTCPHLGCKVEYREASQSYLCPCHASAFTLDGTPTNKIPPRGLDSLETKIDPDGTIWIKYENFQSGVEEKKVL